MSSLLAINTTTGLSDAGTASGYSVALELPQLIGTIIASVLGVLGVIFLVLVIYAGFTWMTSAGNEKLVSKAKNILIQATVGLVITLSAFAISQFVIGALQQTQTASSGAPLP